MNIAIKLKSKVKKDNPEMFEGRNVGDIFQMAIPKTFVRNNQIITRYDLKTEHHKADGFAEIVEPDYNAETHYKGKLKKQGQKFTYKLIAYTQSEIEANADAKIPNQVPKFYFKFRLLDLGVTNDDVNSIIDQMSEGLEKEKLKLMWLESKIVERSNPYLYSLLPALNQLKGTNITENDIFNIFKNYQV